MVMSIERYHDPVPLDDPVPIDGKRTPVGIAVGVGAIGMVAAGLVAAMVPVAYPWWRFGIAAGALVAFAAVSLDRRAVAVVAAIGALIANGFLEDRLGQLAWHGSADLWRLMVLVLAAASGFAVGDAYRFVLDRRSRDRVAAGRTPSVRYAEEGTHGA